MRIKISEETHATHTDGRSLIGVSICLDYKSILIRISRPLLYDRLRWRKLDTEL